MAMTLFLLGLFITIDSIAALNVMRRGNVTWFCRAKYLISALIGFWSMAHAVAGDEPDWYTIGSTAALAMFVMFYGRETNLVVSHVWVDDKLDRMLFGDKQGPLL